MTRLRFGESVYNPADGSWTFPIIEDTTMTDDNLDDVQPELTSSTPGGNPEAGRHVTDAPVDANRLKSGTIRENPDAARWEKDWEQFEGKPESVEALVGSVNGTWNTSRPVEDDVTEASAAEAIGISDETEDKWDRINARRTALSQAVKMLKGSDTELASEDVVAWAKAFEDYLRGDA